MKKTERTTKEITLKPAAQVELPPLTQEIPGLNDPMQLTIKLNIMYEDMTFLHEYADKTGKNTSSLLRDAFNIGLLAVTGMENWKAHPIKTLTIFRVGV